MINKMTLRDYDLKGKRVLVRVDYNVPLNSKGFITNDKRIRETLPTINYLIEQGAKIILCSHLGRPEGKVMPEFSLAPVAERLRELLKKPVIFTGDVAGVDAYKFVRNMDEGDIVMMENLRFDLGEEANDAEFAKRLSGLADIFCNDAFGTMHRAHASTARITEFLPSCAGLLVEKEIEVLNGAIHSPQRPFVVVIGGAKVKDKISLLSNLVSHADVVLIGGAMAYTFLRSQGQQVGKSPVEKDKIQLAKLLLEKAENLGTKILLPVDHVVTGEFNFAAEAIVVTNKNFPRNAMGMDIGPKTIKLYTKYIMSAKTVFWNGPMGVFEFQRFAKGTNAIARAMGKSKATTIIGGGDSASAVEGLKLQDHITHVSTGGGAALKLLEGSSLPGLEALNDKVQ